MTPKNIFSDETEDARVEKGRPSEAVESNAGMAIGFGVLLLLSGIISTLCFCFHFNTLAPGTDIENVGLLNDRLIGVLCSLATAMAGLLIILFNAVKK